MKTNPESENLDPKDVELMRFMDGLDPHDHPEWLEEKAAAQQLGQLLRSHLPSHAEPPSAEFFTSQIMAQIAPTGPTRAGVSARSGFMDIFRRWCAPLATAAAVLVVGGMVMKRQSPGGGREAFAYTPIANVKATLDFNKDAGATVINLTGLTAIPDAREIKAFNVASTGAVAPGATQRFYAANDPDILLFVLHATDDGGPQIREVH